MLAESPAPQKENPVPVGAKRTAPRKPKNPPIHREVGAVICLLLAIFSALGYFDIRAIFVTFLTQLERGLLGYGFWLMPIVLLAASIELFRHFGRPVRLQLTFTLLLPLVAGACVHTVLCTGDYQLKQGIVQTLWDAGIAMRSGGVLSGLLSMGLTWVFSAVGCMILLLIALAACVLGIRRLGPTELVHMLNEWRAARYRAKKQKAQQERKERREKCRYRPEDYVQNQEPREKKLTPGIVLRHGPSARKRSGTEIDIPVAAEEEWAGLKTAAGNRKCQRQKRSRRSRRNSCRRRWSVRRRSWRRRRRSSFSPRKSSRCSGRETGYRRRKCSPGNGRRSCTTTGCP